MEGNAQYAVKHVLKFDVKNADGFSGMAFQAPR